MTSNHSFIYGSNCQVFFRLLVALQTSHSRFLEMSSYEPQIYNKYVTLLKSVTQ